MKSSIYILLAGVFLCSGWLPAIAQTSGPVAPEARTFSPVGANDMVNLFSGDFQYNIPLFELPGPDGGYPFNLFYNSGITASQEASWVGLGWNLNAGTITRQMRNIPDEFNGEDMITHFKTMERSWTVGGTFGVKDVEILGKGAGDKGKKKPVELSLVFTLSYNNMTGLGLSLDPGINYAKANSKLTAGISMSSGNQSGFGMNPTVGINSEIGNSNKFKFSNSFSLGLNLNSINGLQSLRLDGGTQMGNKQSRGYGAGLSFTERYYRPSVSDELKGGSAALQFKLGHDFTYVHLNFFFRGFFSTQSLKYDREKVLRPAYGYNYLGKVIDDQDRNAFMDFIREDDQLISSNIPNLPVPVSTHDIFTANAHGFSAMFKPMRSDIGTFIDPATSTELGDVNLALEFGTPSSSVKFGGDISKIGSATYSSDWTPAGFPAFKQKGDISQNNVRFEPVYYKVFGETSSIDISSFSGTYDEGLPGYVPIRKDGLNSRLLNKLKFPDNSTKDYGVEINAQNSRAARKQVVQHFTNAEINTNPSLFPLYNIQYYASEEPASVHWSTAGTLKNYSEKRNARPPHHIGGFEVIKEDGTRYIFALPVYVNEDINVSFNSYGCAGSNGDHCPYTINIPSASDLNDPTTIAVTDANRQLEVTTIPAYASNFLLTAVVGPDYVDITNNGLSDDDLGYWVKFSYIKTTDQYKWKAPFLGANAIIGQEALSADNMGTFSCGEREVWYLVSAETRTHLAEFNLSRREDARGAYAYCQNSNHTNKLGAYSYKIDSISMYSKLERFSSTHELVAGAIPMKRVRFEYAATVAEELCRKVDNAPAERGKLTLTALNITHRNNNRGKVNGYDFSYSAGENWNNQTDNPDYNPFAVDRWGNYQLEGTGRDISYFAPYTRQGEDHNPEYAGAWSLKKIGLPSGATLNVHYEPDDYAFVQNRFSTTMTKVKAFGEDNNRFYIDIRFPELPAEIQTCNTTCKENYLKMLMQEQEQLFFRIYLNLDNSIGAPQMETVSAYCKYDGLQMMTIEGEPVLRIFVKNAFKAGVMDRHPFRSAALNYIKGNRMDLLTSPFNNPQEVNKTSGWQKLRAVASMLTNIAQFYEMFLSVEAKAISKGLAKEDGIQASGSYIRLPKFDGKKTGGGSRVRSILITENGMTSDTIGTVYDYYTVEELAAGGTVYPVKISSGVAENEPEIANDETAYKGYDDWRNSMAVFSSVSQFSQTPYNSSFYPGASVGYSKVTVRSYASDQVVKGQYDPQVRTTGQTVHEFYTARDFPVIVDKTMLRDGTDNFQTRTIPPLNFSLFSIGKSYLYASQGFSIQLNDMHGKPRKVSSYAQDVDGNIASTPFSWQEYFYRTESNKGKEAHGLPVRNTLSNKVPTMCAEGVVEHTKLQGVEIQQFADVRRVDVVTKEIGLQLNAHINLILIPIPIATTFPTFGRESNSVGSCVVNKVVNRFGIMDSVVSFDKGTYTIIKNEVFDELTGAPVLISTTKSAKSDGSGTVDKTYKYDIQGHWIYEGLDGAYKNAGLELIPGEDNAYPMVHLENGVYKVELGNYAEEVLKNYYPGDEIIIANYTNKQVNYPTMCKAIVESTRDDKLVVNITNGSMPANPVYIKVVRPGRRNIVGATISTVVTKLNPLEPQNRNIENCNN